MAGKVKNKGDDGLQSKTARASMRGSTGGREGYIASADAARIVPLGGGTHAYVLDPRDGRTLRFSVASEGFITTLCTLVEAGHGDRVRRDLADLANRFTNWKDVADRLEAALAPQPVENEEDAA